MRTKNFARNLNWVWVLALAVIFTACSQMEGIEPDSTTLDGKSEELFRLSPFGNGFENARLVDGSPFTIPGDGQGGNRECSEAWDYFVNVINEDADPAIVIPIDPNLTKSWGKFDFPFPANSNTNEVSVDVTDDTFVEWTITPPTGYCVKYVAVIVKGTNEANVFYYDYSDEITSGPKSDSGLFSPDAGKSGSPAELSNLTICYVLAPCDDVPPCEPDDETAMSAGITFPNHAWFTYTPYEDGKKVDLIAGQDYKIGDVTFEEVSSTRVLITITLNDIGGFQNVMENVKIQGWNGTPGTTGNTTGLNRNGLPSFGNFVTHKGTASGKTYEIEVDKFNFYAVHVDGTVNNCDDE